MLAFTKFNRPASAPEKDGASVAGCTVPGPNLVLRTDTWARDKYNQRSYHGNQDTTMLRIVSWAR